MNSKELLIEAGRTESQYWKDIWKYRELFYFLAWRDILVRYKQTVIGMAWALIRPLLTIKAFSWDKTANQTLEVYRSVSSLAHQQCV